MTHQILVAGGCQVLGYGVGHYAGFCEVARRELAKSDCELSCLGHLRLSHPRRLQEECSRYMPDILVLQMGHFETNRVLYEHVLLKLGLRKHPRRQSPTGSPAAQPTQGAKWFIKQQAKQFVDAGFGHTMVDVLAVSGQIRVFMSRVAALHVPAVIVLSPFPCADSVNFSYRRKLGPIFEGEARRYGFRYFDVMALLGDDRSIFFDPAHLNQEGHRRIGAALAAILDLALKSIPCEPLAFDTLVESSVSESTVSLGTLGVMLDRFSVQPTALAPAINRDLASSKPGPRTSF